MTSDDRWTRDQHLERDAMAWPPAAWDTQPHADPFADPRDHSRAHPHDYTAQWPEHADADAPKASAGALAREALQTLLLALVLFVGMRVVMQNYIIESYSMEPTLVEGQQIWVNKLLYRLTGGPGRGDIVVFQAWNQEKPFIKRVVGLPGETVELRDGGVFADGVLVDEPYLGQPTLGGEEPTVLGDGEYFVLGDNRGNSGDSRHYGALPEDGIIGKAWMRYWPLREVGLLHSTDLSFASDWSAAPGP